jgi:N-methylhydantoinase B
VLVNNTGGGGGWGDPYKRRPQLVVDDRNGLVSVGAAAADYGVGVDPATFEIDEALTAKRRTHGDA